MPSVPLGELPPQPPRACFGREELVESIVGLIENLSPIALIGPGGIGKTSIALTVLHHGRVKERFGDDRRFVRCDQFPASRAHFLARLSKVIGAGVENPEDLAALQRSLSSREMILFLDNAESLLDPQEADARGIQAVVEELSRFSNICLGITSRISTVPPHCKRLIIPSLSIESACDIFYSIYDTARRTDIVSTLVRQLDFHALSITLLATTASHNMWDYDRLLKERGAHRAQVLKANYNESLATTIELSLNSLTFRKLGPDARNLLGVVAFFPQGIDENNLDWLFPTIPDRRDTFDKFCVLSLTSRTNGFITMLAPIRDYLRPQDPKSSLLLCITKDRYFQRLSVDLRPSKSGFGEARWIVSEDVNVEHLFDIFTSIDTNSGEVWDACANFMRHIYWYKPRQTVLRAKIEGLPDDHHSKPRCLFELARLFEASGNFARAKHFFAHALKLERERGDDLWIAYNLDSLADSNRRLGLYEEGISQAKEALGIFERLGRRKEQALCLVTLAWLLFGDEQLDGAEAALNRVVNSLPEKGEEYPLYQSHRLLGNIYHSKRAREEAVRHLETALEIASTHNWGSELFWVHFDLAWLFRDEDKFGGAHAHLEQAKSYAANDAYGLALAMETHATIWNRQGRFKEARSEVLHAIEIHEKLGTSENQLRDCKDLLGEIESAMKN